MWDMLRRVLPLLVAFALVPAEVRANYTESRVTTEEARVVVARDGGMVVTHALGVRVLAGTLRTIALTGYEDDVRLRPTAAVTSADGHAYGASIVRDGQGIVHVTVDEPKGLKRGDYRFEVVYEASVAPRLARDGAFDRVRLSLPPLKEGIDGARVVFDFPSAPTEPRAAADPSAGDEATDLATLRRSADTDELELVRPHVAKGEAAAFYARVDPKALSAMPGAASAQPSAAPPPAPREEPPIGNALVVALAALVTFALALAKGRALAGAASPRGMLPGSPTVRAALAALLFGGGVYFETTGRLLAGAGLVACALPLLAWRFAVVPRAPSRAKWLVTKPEEAFSPARAPGELFDATTTRGAIVFALLAAACAVACALARAAGPAAPYLVAIDALALVPLFFTGTSRQMPPSAAREGAALAPVARELGGADVLKIAPLVRDDEVRLLASPRLGMAGAAGIEVGVAWQRAGGASLPSYDVLVRVHDGTFASSKMTAAFPAVRPLPGRKPEERVYRFEPDGPRPRDAAALACELAEVLRDHRLAIAQKRQGPERRLPPTAKKL